MTYTYRVDTVNDNAIYITKDGDDVAMFYQPHWPDGTPWADEAEATAWAEAKIAEITNESAPMAGPSPDQPTVPKPTRLEIVENNLRSMGVTVDDLKELLGL
jgi:hypothetical protein